MNVRGLFLPLLFIWTALTLAVRRFIQIAPTPSAANDQPYEAIDAYVAREMDRLKIPGASLVIVEGDQIVHFHGFGRARPDGTAPSPQTPFLIGSLAKSITALAVMQLVEAGKIVLDAPVQRYLPWFRLADPTAAAQMTVRHLLNQTSGLPTSAGDKELADFDPRPDAAERQARALASLELAHPVGTACVYANMNYNLLGLVIEVASGQSYPDYIREHIFGPLGMSHSYASRSEASRNGLAMGHRYWFGQPIVAGDLPTPRGSLSSGQLISSAEDMARYLIAHLNGGRYGGVQILSAAAIEEMQRGVLEYGRMGVSAGKYGMGWFDGQIGQAKTAWHSGTVPDFGAYMAILPKEKKGLVLLFNASHWWFNPMTTELGIGATALLANQPYSPTWFFSTVPWILPGQLLIPALQILDVTLTLRRLRRWRQGSTRRPSNDHVWKDHVLLPLIPNLSVALALGPILGKQRGYLRLFMPDSFWLAAVCGSFALVWSILRTGLTLRALREPHRFNRNRKRVN